MERDQPHWVGVQHRTFTAWVNQGLKARGLKIENLIDGLNDGVNLCVLLEELSGRSLKGKYAPKPRSRFEKLQNCSSGVNFIKSDGIPLVAIGPEDLVDPKLKLILGLVWMLILHYQIQGASQVGDGKKGSKQNASGAKKELLQWVRDRVSRYNVPVNNFTSSFQNGVVLAALADSFQNGIIDVDAIDKDSSDHALWLATTVNAINKAADLGVPPMIRAEDLVNEVPDELSVMTYVSAFRNLREAEEDPYGCFVLGKGIEDPSMGESNDISVSLYKKKDKSPVVLTPETLDELEITVTTPEKSTQFLKPRNNGNGTYDASYTPLTPGEYDVAVKLYGKFLNGNPRVKVIDNTPKNKIDPSKCKAEGEGLTHGTNSKPSKFVISGYDSAGNFIPTGGAQFTVDVVPEAGGSNVDEADTPFSQVFDEGDGTYAVLYFTPLPGAYKVNVNLDGKPIKDSPFTSKIRAAPSAANCTLQFPNKDGLLVGKKEQFIIEAKDESGNPLKIGGDEFKVTFESGGADTVETSQIDNGDGTYTQTFVCPVDGDYTVDVRIGDESIKGSPLTFNVKKGILTAGNCDAEGEGLKHAWTYRPASFIFTTRDQDGNPIQVDDNEYKVAITGPKGEAVPATVRDNGDGSYLVTYRPENEGPLAVSVDVAGKPIKASPFTVPAEQLVSPPHTTVEGEGVTKLTTNKPTAFVIRTYNKQGQALKEGGDTFDVTVQDPDGNDLYKKVRDNRDGTYTVRYTPPKTGEYTVSVGLYGTPIKDSPFYVNSDKAKDFAAFSFTSKDGSGKGIVDTVRKFDISVEGPKSGKPIFETADIDEGVYGVEFQPSEGPGVYKISVKLDGNHIPNSPFPVRVGGDSADGGEQPVKFPFTPKNKAGQVIKPKRISEFSTTVTGPGEKPCEAELCDNGDGTYGVVFKPRGDGVYKIAVLHNGEHIQGSVFTVAIGDEKASSEGPAPSQGKQPVRFPFVPQDQAGNKIKAQSPNEFDVQVNGPEDQPIPSTLVDLNDGSYGVTFVPEGNGIYKVSVKHGGQPVKGSVFRIPIGPQPAASGPGAPASSSSPSTPPSAQVPAAGAAPAQRNLVRFKFNAKKKDSSEIPLKSPSDLAVDISGPQGDNERQFKPKELIDNKDGTIGLIFDPEGGPGIYKISVKYDGEDIERSPFLLNVGGAAQPPPAAAAATPKAAPTSAPAASAPTQPAVDASGKPIWAPIPGRSFANFPFKPVSKAGETIGSISELDATIYAPDGTQIACLVQDQGQPGVIFQPYIPGEYKINILYKNEPIQGGPFTVEVGGQQQMFSSSEAKFRINAPKDKKGAAIPASTDPSAFGLKVTGPEDKSVEGQVKNNGDGSFDVVFKPFGPGTYILNVSFGGDHIDGSPYKINIGGGGGDGKSVLPQVQGERT